MSLIEELEKIKKQLNQFKSNLNETANEIESKEKTWSQTLSSFSNINKPSCDLITLNIGGTVFQRAKSLFSNDSKEGTLLHYIVTSNSPDFDLSQELFIDRDPTYFPIILEYYENKPINYSAFRSKQEFNLFRREVEFFQLNDVLDFIESKLMQVRFLGFSFSGAYIYNGKIAGTNLVEDILHPDGLTGICAKSPGNIVVELNDVWDVHGLEIGGYRGNKGLWFEENGIGAEIALSVNGKDWTKVGNIPSGFGKDNKVIRFGVNKARFVRFTSSSFVGIGYLSLFKKEIVPLEDTENENENDLFVV